MRCFIRLLTALCCAFAGFQPANAEKRVALIIGNASYNHIAGLPNVPNDAAAMAALFKAAKFDSVEAKHNLGVAELRQALREFAGRAADADVAVLFFAGHGIEVDRVNYLIPVDARLASDLDVEDEAVPLDRALQVLEPARRLRLVILDSCRENPFVKSMKRSAATRSVGRGLGRIEPTTTNTLIAFATKPNAVAEDGKGPNSPFTTALVKHLLVPGLDLRIALGHVRDDVLQTTGHKQEPYVTSSLGGGTIALVPGKSDAGSEHDVADNLEWVRATAANRLDGYRRYIKASPTGKFVSQARARIAELERLAALWEELKTSRSLPRLRSFADETRESEFGAVAGLRLQHLEALEAKDWEDAARKQRLASYQAFVSNWPDGFRIDAARQKVVELEAIKTEWSKIKESDDEGAIEAFILQHGWTEFGAEATAQLVALRRERARPDTDGVKTLTAQDMHRLIDNATITFQGSGEVIRFASRSMPAWRKKLGKDFMKRVLDKDITAEGAFASKTGTRSIEGVGGIVQSKVDKTGSLYLMQMYGTERNSMDVDQKDRLYKLLRIVKYPFGYVCNATDWHSMEKKTNPLKVPERCTVQTTQ